jgi:hypothetical protein
MKNAILEHDWYDFQKEKHPYHATIPQYLLEGKKLLRWIDAFCRYKGTLFPSVVLPKAKEIGHSEGFLWLDI